MDEFKTLVEELEGLDNKEDIVAKLQEIGKKLLTEYVIKVGDLVIEPLWLEAYYFNSKTSFLDPFIHGADEQSHYKILYFHHKTDDSRSGVDICLSLGNDSENKYYLSYLIKYSLVNGKFTTQSQLSSKIRQSYDALSDKSNILFKISDYSKNDIIGYTTRIGLKAKDSKPDKEKLKIEYAPYELAIAKNFDMTYSISKKLPKVEKLADSYLSKYNSSKEKWCIKHLGYCPSKYRGK